MRAKLTDKDLETLSARTIRHYDEAARSFNEGTRDHDVSQNYVAFLRALTTSSVADGHVARVEQGQSRDALTPSTSSPSFKILDFGCGPGRDLAWFRSRGHEAVGLDGSLRFVEMARAASQCVVLHQTFLHLSLETYRFDGVFANASLFHVPTQELARVLRTLRDSLVNGGVLFCSNPHGPDSEGFSGDRYGAFHSLETWRMHVTAVGFTEIEHYYRPEGRPRHQQPWLATVWRKP